MAKQQAVSQSNEAFYTQVRSFEKGLAGHLDALMHSQGFSTSSAKTNGAGMAQQHDELDEIYDKAFKVAKAKDGEDILSSESRIEGFRKFMKSYKKRPVSSLPNEDFATHILDMAHALEDLMLTVKLMKFLVNDTLRDYKRRSGGNTSDAAVLKKMLDRVPHLRKVVVEAFPIIDSVMDANNEKYHALFQAACISAFSEDADKLLTRDGDIVIEERTSGSKISDAVIRTDVSDEDVNAALFGTAGKGKGHGKSAKPATAMSSAATEAFKDGVIKSVKEVFIKNNNLSLSQTELDLLDNMLNVSFSEAIPEVDASRVANQDYIQECIEKLSLHSAKKMESEQNWTPSTSEGFSSGS